MPQKFAERLSRLQLETGGKFGIGSQGQITIKSNSIEVLRRGVGALEEEQHKVLGNTPEFKIVEGRTPARTMTYRVSHGHGTTGKAKGQRTGRIIPASNYAVATIHGLSPEALKAIASHLGIAPVNQAEIYKKQRVAITTAQRKPTGREMLLRTFNWMRRRKTT